MLKHTLTLTAAIILPLTSFGQEKAKPAEKPKEQKPAVAEAAETAKKAKKPAKQKPAKAAEKVEQPKKPAEQDHQAILEELTLFNSLSAEKHKKETAGLRAEIAKLKLEKELFSEKLSAVSLKKNAEKLEELAAYEAEKEQLTREAAIAKLELETLSSRLKAAQTQASLQSTKLEGQIREIETRKKREAYADATPQYLSLIHI